MYKALKQCKFDRKYGVGEVIQEGVADKECFSRAIAYGYTEVVADEAQKTPKAELEAEEVVLPVEAKRRGRKKAVV